MALSIPGYTYIQHKTIQRPWGPECQFTVADVNGNHINETVAIPSVDSLPAVLEPIIADRIAQVVRVEAEPTETIYITCQDGTVGTLEVPL